MEKVRAQSGSHSERLPIRGDGAPPFPLPVQSLWVGGDELFVSNYLPETSLEAEVLRPKAITRPAPRAAPPSATRLSRELILYK